MKKSIPITIIFGALIGAAQLTAAEKWEGTQDFGTSSPWNGKSWGGYNQAGRFMVANGRVVYSCAKSDFDNACVWFWGPASNKGFDIPTARCWEIQAEATYPEFSPSSNYSDVGIGLAIYAPEKKGRYRCDWARMQATYVASKIASTIDAESDFNFESREGEDGGGPAELTETIATRSGLFRLVFRHDALNRLDTFEVRDAVTTELLYERVDPTTLFSAANCKVGFWMSIDRYALWPAGSSYLAMDNWKMSAFEPTPINLNTKSGSGNGVAYSVAVTNLGMTGAKLNGTVAITVGSASATLPITGSIDKNGYFALTAKGTGANKGFGCVLLYDVATGTYRPSKNTVTAPKQKAIKF
ncbi:MAG: hypothetical protein EBZ78_08245 [Verrucomicrobia bacterium]|nr:hypothetical protein [Verrucomicrobiota bacterium]